MSRHLNQLASNIAASPYRSARRLDPYWDGVWAPGANGHWLTASRMKRWDEARLIQARRLSRNLTVGVDTAAGRIRQMWEPKLSLLASLFAWKTATVEQVAALTGIGDIGVMRSRPVGDLFALEIADVGDLVLQYRQGAHSSRARMVRPALGSAFDRLFAPELTYPELVSITGGMPWSASGRYERHNVLTVELMLRAAEFLPGVATILGEPFSTVTDLLHGGTDQAGSSRAGDAVLVREDGLRIVFETAATVNARSAGLKARRWAEDLAARPFDDNGVVVVFLAVDRHDPFDLAVDRSNTRQMAKFVRQAVDQFPGRGANRTADRMFVASWQDWFPGPHQAGDGFDLLLADAAVGGDSWESRALLDPASVPAPARMSAPLDVVAAASGLRSVPHQLRRSTHERPQFDSLTLARTGWESLPPHRAGDKWRDRPQRADPFAPSGARSVAVLPDRYAF
ncbi:hypothetical protein [Microbacterium sp.]|uniref:hypothetical protein n=1 Tax=Microbacterium sp. TaxID=51671 RepID=UPI003F9A451B